MSMDPLSKSGGTLKKVKRGKQKEISPYELLLRNSHELLWRKLSEYTVIHLGIVRVKVWFPDLKLASSIKLDRCSSVDSAISYIARKKKITSPHCGLFLERHGESGVWLENNTPLWLYDLQASDVLEYKPRPAYASTAVSVRVFIVEQKVFKSTFLEKTLKISDLVALFQVQFGLMKDSEYYGFNLLSPEANEIWLDDECTLSSYLVHNMSVIEYKKKPVIVLEPVNNRILVAKTCVLHQNISVMEASSIMKKWLKQPENGWTEVPGIFFSQQNIWMEKDCQLGVYPFKPNDVIALGYGTDSPETLLLQKDVCARVIFAAPPGKNFAKVYKLPLLPGEVPVFKVTNVIHLSNFTSPSPASLSGGVVGDITISNYRLTFWALQSSEISVEIPVAGISKVEKKGKNKNEIFHGYFLDILCKDNRFVRFYWPHHDDSRKKLYHCLKELTFPGDQHKLFAFLSEEEFSFDGWSILNFEAEYQRQKISNKLWRVSLINANYQMCDSYPPLLAVPAKITDDQLRAVFEFRSKGRIPVMTWQHPINGTSISRCSQPLSGIRMTRCPEDEALIREMGFANQPLVVDKLEKNLFVLDCRPKVNAMGNRAKGAGYEDTTTSYPNCILEFLDIGNIHVMRESHEKLLDICLQAVGGAPGGGWSGSGPTDWLSRVASTKWLDHICTIFEATARVIDCIHNQEISVLLHCSDGWDRTAQVSSLSLLLLDPYHRTLRGFVLLIEKEWLSFGHKFAQRHGFGDSKHLDERSPVFLQFLDCVWQMTQQFPYAFEFNEAFLLAILTHLHSCRFGTFLFNSYCERNLHSVRERTKSLWSMLLSPPYVHEYINLFYEPSDQVLIPNTASRYFQLWHRAHLSWYMTVPPSAETRFRQYAHNQALTIEKLTRHIEELKTLLDSNRTKHTESKSAIQPDTKLSTSESTRGIFTKNLRAPLLYKPPSSLATSGPTTTQWDSSYSISMPSSFSTSLGNPQFNLYSSDDSLSSIATSSELTNSTLLRGDSPFGNSYPAYSSTEEDFSDDDDSASSLSFSESLTYNTGITTHTQQNPHQYNHAHTNGVLKRSPSIGVMRLPNSGPNLSPSPSPSPSPRAMANSGASPFSCDNSANKNTNSPLYHPPSPRNLIPSISTGPANVLPSKQFATLTRSASPSVASSFIVGKINKTNSKTASDPNVAYQETPSIQPHHSASDASTSPPARPLPQPPNPSIVPPPHARAPPPPHTHASVPPPPPPPRTRAPSPPPTFALTPASPRFLRSAVTLTKPTEIAVSEEPTNNSNIATYIATVGPSHTPSGSHSPSDSHLHSNSRSPSPTPIPSHTHSPAPPSPILSPRARDRGATATLTNSAGVSSVANYISQNYNLSRSSTLPPPGLSPSSSRPPSPFRSTPPRSPSPSPQLETKDEIKWQPVHRSPSSRSLSFLDQPKCLNPS